MESLDLDPRDRKRSYFQATHIRKLAVEALHLKFKFIMARRVEGLEHLPADGPVIVAANHGTNFDVFPMQLSVPDPLFVMRKAELFRIPLLGGLLRQLGAWPVCRGKKDRWALQHASRVVAHGQALGMFPQETRSRGRGPTVAKTGTGRPAIDANCPIVPMAAIGSDRFFRHFPRRARVMIKLLPSTLPDPGKTPLSLTDRLKFSLVAALLQKARGVYSEIQIGFRI